MFGTVTRLSFETPDATMAAAEGLDSLLEEVRGREGFGSGHLIRTGEAELVLVTTYSSEEAADAISAELRPRLAGTIGSLVAGPPERLAGAIVASADEAG
jgi:hypothetical protein